MHGFVRGQCSSTWMDFKRDRFGSAERNRTRLVKVRRGRRTFTRPDFAYVPRYRYPDDRYRDRELWNKRREREFFRRAATTRRAFPPDCLNL